MPETKFAIYPLFTYFVFYQLNGFYESAMAKRRITEG
jgi:hypothetical protein